jgi:hypothetical protein
MRRESRKHEIRKNKNDQLFVWFHIVVFRVLVIRPEGGSIMLSVERVVLINLKRRPDRLAAFRRLQSEKGWRLPEPQIFEAIDGAQVGEPSYYLAGAGAWGCLRSHVSILERAIMDDVSSILVLEDDLTWHADAWDRLAAFAKVVPPDWDQLMLGGQHIRPPSEEVAGHHVARFSGQELGIPRSGRDDPATSDAKAVPAVVRCTNCQRTHAYAVRGKALRDLLRLWYPCKTHIDHLMGPWQRSWKVYAPDPFVFGQGPGRSDVSGANNPAKFWVAPSGDTLVIHLTAPAEVVRRLRGYGLHTGYQRDPETDYDRGLVELLGSSHRVAALRKWLGVITWEAASEDGAVACVWHPEISASEVRAAHGGEVVEVKGETVEACLAQLPKGLKLRPNYAASHVIVLRSPREVMEALRGHGWHSGYWRDEVTGEDNGLRRIVVRQPGRVKALAEWVATVGAEAEVLPGGVPTIWHPRVSADEVRAACPGRAVVEVKAETAAEAMAKWSFSLESEAKA